MKLESFHRARTKRASALAGGLLVLLAVASTSSAAPAQGAFHAVYTASNDTNANEVIAYDRSPSGSLDLRGTYATGGLGTGGGLGNQGGIALDRAGQHLLVVNAGDDTVSIFDVRPRGLVLMDVEPSGGSQPISVTVSHGRVFVLNAGGDGNIAAMAIESDGTLTLLPGGSTGLSSPAPGPAQIAFSPDGRQLLVTEKATNNLVTYRVDPTGRPTDQVVTASEGTTPFGFSFSHRSRVMVSEAAGGMPRLSTVSSYDLRADGTLVPLTSALPTTQTAACWLVTTPSGRFAYTTNTGSDSVTGLTIGGGGSLGLLDTDGYTAAAGDAPIDAAFSHDGRFLYVLNGADDSLGAYRVRSDGSLQSIGSLTGLPAGVNGLAAY